MDETLLRVFASSDCGVDDVEIDEVMTAGVVEVGAAVDAAIEAPKEANENLEKDGKFKLFLNFVFV